MRSGSVKYAILLLVQLLSSTSGSLLRGDQTTRSQVLLQRELEFSYLGKNGKKSSSSQSALAEKSKRKKREFEGEKPPVSKGTTEKREKQIVHSHHPASKATTEKQEKQVVHSHHPASKGTSKERGKQIVHSHHPKAEHAEGRASEKGYKRATSHKHSKSPARKDNTKQQHKSKGIALGIEDEEEDGAAGRTNNRDHFGSGSHDTNTELRTATYTDIEERLPIIVDRSIEFLAIEYDTSSTKIPTEVEYLYLAHITENLLTTMYSRVFESAEMVHFEGLEIYRYKPINPLLIQFEVAALFQQEEGVVVPSLMQVKNVVEQGLAEAGDFYSEYMNILEQMPFEVFSTTKSFRVITDSRIIDDEQLQGPKDSDGEEKPKLLIIFAAAIATLATSICAAVWIRSVKRAQVKSLEDDCTYRIEPAMSNFKTATFDDPAMDDDYSVDEHDLENHGEENLEDINLGDAYNTESQSERKAAENSLWDSDDERCTTSQLTFNRDDGRISTSASQKMEASISAGSADSVIASQPEWLSAELKHADSPAHDEVYKQGKHSEEKLPQTDWSLSDSIKPVQTSNDHEKPPFPVESEKVHGPKTLPAYQMLKPKASSLSVRTNSERSSFGEEKSSPSSETNAADDKKPIWMTQRLRPVRKIKDEASFRKQSTVVKDTELNEKPLVQLSPLELTPARPSTVSLPTSEDVPTVQNTRGEGYPSHNELLASTQKKQSESKPTADSFSSRIENTPTTDGKGIPLWIKKRQEIMSQSKEMPKQEDNFSDKLATESQNESKGTCKSTFANDDDSTASPSLTNKKDEGGMNADDASQKSGTSIFEQSVESKPDNPENLPVYQTLTPRVSPLEKTATSERSSFEKEKTSPLSDTKPTGDKKPIWMTQRLRPVNKAKNEGRVPKQSIALQEQPELNDNRSARLSLEDQAYTVTLSILDVPTVQETSGGVHPEHHDLTRTQNDQSKPKAPAESITDGKDGPLWIKKRHEILRQSDEESMRDEKESAELIMETQNESKGTQKSDLIDNNDSVASLPVTFIHENGGTSTDASQQNGAYISEQSKDTKADNPKELLVQHMLKLKASPRSVTRSNEKSSNEDEKSIPSTATNTSEQKKPIWMTQRLRTVHQANDGASFRAEEQRPELNETPLAQLSSLESTPDRATTLTLPTSNVRILQETSEAHSAHHELICAQTDQTEANVDSYSSRIESTLSTDSCNVPLWIKKRQEILMESDEDSVRDDNLDDESITEPPIEGKGKQQSALTKDEDSIASSLLTFKQDEGRMSTENVSQDVPVVQATSSQIHSAHHEATLTQEGQRQRTTAVNSSEIERTPSADNKDTPLWMRKREEIVMQSEEDSVQDEELDEESHTAAPAWMMRFKQMDVDE